MFTRRTAILAALVSVAVATPACGSTPESHEPVATAVAPDAAAGRALYRQHCAHCHGFNLVNPGVSAPDLRRFPSTDRTRFVDTVENGRNAMPSWQQKLSATDIEALWAYISTTAAQTPGP